MQYLDWKPPGAGRLANVMPGYSQGYAQNLWIRFHPQAGDSGISPAGAHDMEAASFSRRNADPGSAGRFNI